MSFTPHSAHSHVWFSGYAYSTGQTHAEMKAMKESVDQSHMDQRAVMDEKGKVLDEKGKVLDEKGKVMDEKLAKLEARKRWFFF
jgi:hypothetical protein